MTARTCRRNSGLIADQVIIGDLSDDNFKAEFAEKPSRSGWTMPSSTCDREGCDRPARWLAYAAYAIESNDIEHTLLARYPMPMVRACSGEHLTWELGRDAATHGSTAQWLVTPAITS